MSKKILISLSVIGVVAAIVIGATTAYFSDTETSRGNLFAAGSIDLKIDNTCYLNGDPVGDCTWGLTDLDGELFFDFEGLKPGDWGEDTVSLHVYDNDAWACVTFENMVDDDNGCTEPEAEEGDTNCGNGEGELSSELYFVFWADMCDEGVEPGDNIFQPWCEELLMEGYADDILPGKTYVLADSENENVFTGVYEEPLDGSTDYYIGKVWCFGDLEDSDLVPEYGVVWTCDGEPVDNMTQSDSLEADIIFYAEQARNNPNFRCVQPEIITVESATLNFSSTGWGGWSCPVTHPNVVGGTTDCTLPLNISQPAKAGVGTYPDYPHYTYTSPEEGWVVQNGDTPQSCYIVITCQAD